MTGIGGGDDAVDLEPAIRVDRHLSAGRDIAAIAHELGEPVKDAGWGIAVTCPFGSGIELGKMLRFQHLAAEFERILAGGMGKLVDEALAIDRVLIGVYAAPEAGPDMRVAIAWSISTFGMS